MMSSKRAKRHQLIVRASNGTRAENKQAGRKIRGPELLYISSPILYSKPRFRNLESLRMRNLRGEHPYAGSYKQHKTEMIRFVVWMLEPAGKLKGMGTIK